MLLYCQHNAFVLITHACLNAHWCSTFIFYVAIANMQCSVNIYVSSEVGASQLVEACGIHGSRLPAWKCGKGHWHFQAGNREPCIPYVCSALYIAVQLLCSVYTVYIAIHLTCANGGPLQGWRGAAWLLLSSPLSREVGGRRYYGVSKEKAAARAEYEDRKVNSENVGLVESRSVLVCGGVMWWCVEWCVKCQVHFSCRCKDVR